MARKAITTETGAAVGPYSHAVRAGKLLYLSGQTPLDPATGKLLDGDVQAQTAQCFQNLFGVLRAAGLTPDDVVKVNVFLTDMADFAAMNEVYGQYLAPEGVVAPARSTIEVARLPKDSLVEIEVVAQR